MDESATPLERWIPVVGYEGVYDVSDLGRVRSLPGGPGRLRSIRILKTGLRRGYHSVLLCRDGNDKRRYVHHLVLEAFVGPRPDGQETLHGPGGQLDNRLANLCYGTHEQNMGPDRERDGTLAISRGEMNGNARLTWDAVAEIRRRFAPGMSYSAFGREYGVNHTAIKKVVTGRTWKHVA